MAGQEEKKETFDFFELIDMLESDHKLEVMELKQLVEERELEVAKLNKELENKEASRKEAWTRVDFWYRMNEATSKLVKMNVTPKQNPVKDPFLEKGQRKPTRKKKKNQMKSQKLNMNLMTNSLPMQRNMMTNLKTQIMKQKPMKLLTMRATTMMPALACSRTTRAEI